MVFLLFSIRGVIVSSFTAMQCLVGVGKYDCVLERFSGQVGKKLLISPSFLAHIGRLVARCFQSCLKMTFSTESI